MNSDQSNFKCDGKAPDNISYGWYRMMGKAGGQMIPEECVPTKRCGTKAPGWLNGKHPTVQEGIVDRQVCYHWSDNCCKWKTTSGSETVGITMCMSCRSHHLVICVTVQKVRSICFTPILMPICGQLIALD